MNGPSDLFFQSVNPEDEIYWGTEEEEEQDDDEEREEHRTVERRRTERDV